MEQTSIPFLQLFSIDGEEFNMLILKLLMIKKYSFKKLLICIVFILLIASDSTSAEHKANKSAHSGYDSATGFYIEDLEGNYTLNIGAYSQFRYSLNYRNDLLDSLERLTKGFSIPITEIFLFGSFTKKFDYQFRVQINEASEFNLLVSYLQYNFSKTWNLTFGKQFIPLSREDWQYAQDVLGIDFSANDYSFAVGTSLGLVLSGTTSDKIRMWLGISNGAFSSKHDYGSTQSEVLFSGRLEYQIIGKDWSVWDDLLGRRGRTFGVLLGVAPAYLINEEKEYGNESQANLDLSVNGDGYQLLLAGSWTRRKPIEQDYFYNYGFYAQGGYFLSDNWQIYLRYDQVSPGNEPGDFEDFRSSSIGVNWLVFPQTNRWKFTAEFGYLLSTLNNTIVSPSQTLGWLQSEENGQTLFRLQVQFGI